MILARFRNPQGPAVLLGAVALCVLGAGACNSPRTPDAGRSVTSDGGAVAVTARADGGHDPCEALTPEQRGLIVARVGESSLTVCDFARRINLQNQYLRARFSAPEQRRALLRAWVDSELLAAEARTRGLDQEPAVRHAITSQLARQMETDLRAGVQPPIVTDAEVEQYFNAHRAEYDTPAQVRASQIVLPTRERAERVLAEARAHAADDAFWRELARRETSDTATRDIGGDLGFFTAQGGNTVVPEVAAAAFTLQNAGDVAETVVQSAHGGANRTPGFHVVRLVAKRAPMQRTLEEVRRPIRNRLWRERFDSAQESVVRTLVQQLRARSTVTVNEAALAQVRIEPDRAAIPPAAPAAPGSSASATQPPARTSAPR